MSTHTVSNINLYFKIIMKPVISVSSLIMPLPLLTAVPWFSGYCIFEEMQSFQRIRSKISCKGEHTKHGLTVRALLTNCSCMTLVMLWLSSSAWVKPLELGSSWQTIHSWYPSRPHSCPNRNRQHETLDTPQ